LRLKERTGGRVVGFEIREVLLLEELLTVVRALRLLPVRLRDGGGKSGGYVLCGGVVCLFEEVRVVVGVGFAFGCLLLASAAARSGGVKI